MTQMIRKDQPSDSQVHLDKPLTTFSLAFMQDASGFVASQTFPTIKSDKQSDKYYTYDIGYFTRNEMKLRADGDEVQTIGYAVSNDNFYCDVYGIGHDVGPRRLANADAAIKTEQEVAALLSGTALIHRELQWASKFFVNSVWGTSVTGVDASPGANQVLRWDQAAASIIDQIEVAKQAVGSKTGKEPNTLTINRQTWAAMRKNAEIVDRVKYTGSTNSPARVSLQTVAEVLELDRINVGKAIYNSGLEGQANSMSYILGKHALLTYTPPAVGLYTPVPGATFVWSGYAPGEFGVRMTREKKPLSGGAERWELESTFAFKLMAPSLGYFFNTIIA